MRRSFALMLAALLLVGTIHAAWAGDEPRPQDEPAVSGQRGIGFQRGWRHHDGRDGDFRPCRPVDCQDRGWGRGARQYGPRGHRGFGGPDRHFGGMGMGRGQGFGLMRFDQLDLTADQKTRLIDVMADNYRATLEARFEMMEAGNKLRALRREDGVSSETIIEANAAAGAAKGKLEVLHRQMRDDVEKILTPDQIKKLEEGRRPPSVGRDDRRPDGSGPRGPGRPGPRW